MRAFTLRRPSWISACLLGVIASCSGNPAQFAASGTIGPAGGTVTVTSGPLTGTVITVPPGAVNATFELIIAGGSRPILPGFENVGPSTNVSPTGVGLDVTGAATLVFDPMMMPAGTTAADLIVIRQTSQGRRISLDPNAVNMGAGTLTVDLDQFANYWVSVRTRNLDLVLAAYFPLIDGDTYVYDNGFVVGVENTFTEPNLEGIFVSKATFARDLDSFGLYLVRDIAETLLVGTFVFPAFQEVIFPPLEWLQSTGTVGMGFMDVSFSTIFAPFASFFPTDVLEVRLQVLIESTGSLTTPLGSFSDVLEVKFMTERENADGEIEEIEDTLWLARGVGPVRIELDDVASGDGRLLSGFVAGLPIIPQ